MKFRRPTLRQIASGVGLFLVILYGFWFCMLVLYRWVMPPFTGVHVERRIQSWFNKGEYKKQYQPVPLGKISVQIQHAVVAAEDGRFFQHHGFDWQQIEHVLEKEVKNGRPRRGASTITQQLVKNLFLTTSRSPVRKAFEITLTPMAELVLPKQRILELYLNVIEWGPGVFGIEAASQYHYHTSAARLSRDQAARLAACVPSPRRRKPARMDQYGAIIEERMRLLGY